MDVKPDKNMGGSLNKYAHKYNSSIRLQQRFRFQDILRCGSKPK